MASKTFLDIGALGLYTETALHCGSEGGTGYVDMPIQRERHTRYPVIPGSTIKGVLRDELKPELGTGIDAIFGTEDAKGPGSVSFGDGILAAFPVRSSDAPFHWVTCPFVLERVFRLLGKALEPPGNPGPRKAWAREGGRPVLLEELRVQKVAHPGFFGGQGDSGIDVLLGLLPDGGRGFEYTRRIFRERLLILSDEDLRELAETATEVVTRIKLNAHGTTRTIPAEEAEDLSLFERQGNLFVQEVLPPESLFVSALRGNDQWKDRIQEAIGTREVVRLGGDETIGRGVTRVTFVTR